MGGLLTLPSFTRVFPEICTTDECTQGMNPAEKSHRSTIQGQLYNPSQTDSFTDQVGLGLTVSSYTLGCFFGSIFIMRFGNIFGRRWSILIGCTLVSIGAILQFTSFGLPQFVVARVVCGFGTGINTSTVPVWQAECTRPHQRGPVLAFETSMVILGVMVSYWVDFGFSYVHSSAAWRAPIALQLVFAFFVLGAILFMPESPRWLILKNRPDEAAIVVSAIYGLPIDHVEVADELRAIQTLHNADADTDIRDMFRQGPLKSRTRASIAVTVQIISQLSGINIITYYAATIYENEIGLSPLLSRILAACNGTQYFISTLFSIPLVRSVNRRKLLMLCSAGEGLTMIVLAVCTSVGGSGPGIVAAVFLFVFNTFFGIAWAQISWLYPAEITAFATRAPANALSTSSNWIFNFMVVMVTPVAFSNIGYKTYIIFAVLNLAAVPIMFMVCPETRGRSLEEIDLIFSKTSTLREAVQASFTLERHYDKHGRLIKSVAEDVEANKGAMMEHLPPAESSHVERTM